MDSFKKVILPILLTIIFIIVAGVFYRKNQGLSPFPFNPTKTPSVSRTKTVMIREASIKAEVAESNTERQKGLSGRFGLDKDAGMLFVINNRVTRTFWMKDMKFAIDIIWIKDGKIIQIDKNIEPPAAGIPKGKLNLYSPKTAVDYVLEVNAGYSDLKGIKVGDSVLIE